MNIKFVSNNNINEGWGDGSATFRNCDRVIGPDGTIYSPKYIISLVNNACDILTEVTQGTITKYLGALPILYTFSVDTMATDTEFIYINPGFVMWLFEQCDHTVMGIAFVIMHEVYHNLFMHHAREAADPAKYADHDKANLAQDFEINWVIEHSFPDMRSEDETDPDDPDDSPFNTDGTRKQIMEGITTRCKGAINSKYANMCWEDIYDKLTPDEVKQFDKQDEDENENSEIPTSQDFDDGYRDGWNDAIREARAQGLLESATVEPGFINDFIKLFEASGKSQDYDTGYNYGKQKALAMIKSLLGQGEQTGEQSGSGPSAPKFHPIDGLETMKPKNVDKDAVEQMSSKSDNDPNAPVDLSSSNKNNDQQQNSQNQQNSQGQQNSQSQQSGSQSQQGQQGQQANSQGQQSGSQGQQGDASQGSSSSDGDSTDSGAEGTGDTTGNASGDDSTDSSIGKSSNGGSFNNIKNTSKTGSDSYGSANNANDGQGAEGENGQTTSGGQYSDDYSDKKGTIKVGVADGKYSGKKPVGAGRHHISEAEGKALQKAAGYEDPSKADSNYAGRAENNPFTEGNWEELAKAIDTMNRISGKALIGANPGSGRSSTLSAIANRLKEVMTPIVDWREEMKNRLDAAFSELVDAGWNKKGITRNIYNRFDDYEGNSLQNLIIMIDTSGSVEGRPQFLQQIISEFNDIGRKVNPKCIDLVLFNDGVYYEEEIEDEDAPDLTDVFKKHMVSGGTTYMECFKYIQEEYIEEGKSFACCIIFTDTDITWNTERQIPKEEDLEWDPGHEGDDAAKLLWFILNDSDEHIEMPYGGIIEVSQDQFEKSLKNNYMTNESAVAVSKVPRRSIMTKNNKLLNEAGYFKNIDAEKKKRAAAAAAAAAAPQEPGAEAEQVPQAPVKKKRIDPEQRRLNIIRSLRAAGKIDEYKQLILNWVKTHTNISDRDFNPGWGDPKAILTDDLYVDVSKDLIITGVDLGSMESYVNFRTVNGNLTIGSNRNIQELPSGLPREVTGDFMCINMPNLKSLWGAPTKVGGNYILSGCKNIETLDGAPKSLDDFGGYFLSDSRFSNDDFFETIQNGGVMVDSEYEIDNTPAEEVPSDGVAESLKTRKNIESLIESRIELGKKFNNSLNEAFSSRILSRLAKNPKNKEALDRMKSLNIFWSDIPDEIITPVYGSVTKVIQARRVINRDTTKFGITICCDSNDTISVIGTGDNQGDWRGDTWKFLAPGVVDLINRRVDLVVTANAKYKSEEERQDAIGQLNNLGINWEKSDIQRLGKVRKIDSDLKFPHLYLIPELCAKSYVIKGIDDSNAENMHLPDLTPEQKRREEITGMNPRRFSYRSQNLGRNNLSVARRTANTGIISNPQKRTFTTVDDEGNQISKTVDYSLRNRENDPAYRKYYRNFVDSDILKRIQEVHGSKIGLKKCIADMVESVKTSMRVVRTELLKAANTGEIDDESLDALNARFLLSTYNKFKSRAENAIVSLDSEAATTQSYVDKYLRKREYVVDDEGNPKMINGKPVRATLSIDKRVPTALFVVDNNGMPLKDAEGNWMYVETDSDNIRNIIDKSSSWEKAPGIDSILKTDPNDYYTVEWYKLYTRTLKILAEIMAALDSVKRGHPEKLREYVNKIIPRLEGKTMDSI